MTTRDGLTVGQHLRVRRPIGYWHHGVYVAEGRVVQFGGRITDKPGAAVREVSLIEFADGGSIEVVPHPGAFMLGLGMGTPPASSPAEVVARARWLAMHSPHRSYNLVGSNCEHVANWVMTGYYFESLQARAYFVAPVLIDLGLAAWARTRGRSATAVRLIVTALGVTIPAIYWTVPYRRWSHVLNAYPGIHAPG